MRKKTGDMRKGTGRRENGDRRLEKGDRKWEKGDRRLEKEDRRCEKGYIRNSDVRRHCSLASYPENVALLVGEFYLFLKNNNR